jgi:polynucleotide 5'-kinase involved in rRNA processing
MYQRSGVVGIARMWSIRLIRMQLSIQHSVQYHTVKAIWIERLRVEPDDVPVGLR